MQFNALVDEVQELSLEEKLEMRGLLDRYLVEEERQRIARSHQESLVELREGRFDFTDDVPDRRPVRQCRQRLLCYGENYDIGMLIIMWRQNDEAKVANPAFDRCRRGQKTGRADDTNSYDRPKDEQERPVAPFSDPRR